MIVISLSYSKLYDSSPYLRKRAIAVSSSPNKKWHFAFVKTNS